MAKNPIMDCFSIPSKYSLSLSLFTSLSGIVPFDALQFVSHSLPPPSPQLVNACVCFLADAQCENNGKVYQIGIESMV